MTIDGQGVEGERAFPIINPATGMTFADAPDCTLGQLDIAMQAAERALIGWRRDEARRRQTLHDCATTLRANADRLSAIFTREQGRPLAGAITEVRRAA